MKQHRLGAITAFSLSVIFTGSAFGQVYPPEIPGARVETYKTVDGLELNVWILFPEGHQASDPRPAMVFFFGGGWVQGTPAQFERQARILRKRGMVAILADYRVYNRHNTRGADSVEDAKSVMRWVRGHSSELGIDPVRIGAAGGSAGGHLAAATATLQGFDAADDDLKISPVPNLLVLFNPVAVVAPLDGVFQLSEDLQERMGAPLQDLSPYHHLGADTPPTIIMHGTEDQTVPFVTAEAYCKRVVETGGECTLVPYAGADHGFFNRDPFYEPTLQNMLDFLESQNLIEQ